MRRTTRICKLSVLPAIFVICFTCSPELPQKKADSGLKNTTVSRIVSLAPSITESLFALSLGNSVVGVTDFCNYPAQAQHIEKVGGYLDPNLEKILLLHPDQVILLKEHQKVIQFLKQHEIKYLLCGTESVAAICSTFYAIGSSCNRKEEAEALIKQFTDALVPPLTEKPKIPVLICVGRNDIGSGAVTAFYAAGPGSYYNDLLNAAGAYNVLSKTPIPYPELSLEGLMALNPQVIIDLSISQTAGDSTKALNDWMGMQSLRSVKNKTVFCIAGGYVSIPGPRTLLLLRDLKAIINSVRNSAVESSGKSS